MAVDIWGIGHCCQDNICVVEQYPPEDGSTHILEIDDSQGGGAAATAMVAASRLGARAGVIANLGDDPVGDRILDGFHREGVQTELIRRIQMTGAKVIASTHDFEKTDDSKTLKNRFIDMDASGADILKMAVMPQRFEDVADLMQVTSEVTEEYTEKPVIAMSMGNLGSMSRIAGENFGSSVTFATVGKASAPGQFPVEELRMMMNALHKKNVED